MTARTQSYCENVMALFNGRSQETDVFCKEHFDVVYHRLEPAYREREEEWREWRAAETAGLATEIQESVDRFWGFMNKQYDRTGETKSPMPKLDLLLHEERRRSTKAMDQIAEDRLTLQTKLEDAAFEAKKSSIRIFRTWRWRSSRRGGGGASSTTPSRTRPAGTTRQPHPRGARGAAPRLAPDGGARAGCGIRRLLRAMGAAPRQPTMRLGSSSSSSSSSSNEPAAAAAREDGRDDIDDVDDGSLAARHRLWGSSSRFGSGFIGVG